MTQSIDEKRLYNHVLGGLAGAGMGDALGAATEQWHHTEIFAKFGGPLRSFQQPPPDTWSGAESNKLGQVTDDASQMFYLANKLIECDGSLTHDDWVACLLQWADESPHVGNMGPTTRLVVQALKDGEDPNLVGVIGTSDRQPASHGATNGAASSNGHPTSPGNLYSQKYHVYQFPLHANNERFLLLIEFRFYSQ